MIEFFDSLHEYLIAGLQKEEEKQNRILLKVTVETCESMICPFNIVSSFLFKNK